MLNTWNPNPTKTPFIIGQSQTDKQKQNLSVLERMIRRLFSRRIVVTF